MTANPLLEPQPVGAARPTSGSVRDRLGPAPATGRIVVAADGSHASDAALRVGERLADRDGSEAVLLTVYEPPPTLGDPSALTTELAEMDRTLHAQFRRDVEGQLARFPLDATRWRTADERGHPARTIARAAAELGARLIVLGLGRHGPLERALGKETALQVARLAHVPVLAVPPTARALPRRAIVAVDFSASSRAAARGALALLGEKGALYLIHVAPTPVIPGADLSAWDPAWQGEYDRAAERQLADFERELEAPEGVHVARVLKRGDAAREILALAAAEEIDVIATGSHGHPALVRAFVGSVSTRVVRSAHCAVLLTPPVAPMPRV